MGRVVRHQTSEAITIEPNPTGLKLYRWARLKLDVRRTELQRLVDHEVGADRADPGYGDVGVEAEDVVQEAVSARWVNRPPETPQSRRSRAGPGKGGQLPARQPPAQRLLPEEPSTTLISQHPDQRCLSPQFDAGSAWTTGSGPPTCTVRFCFSLSGQIARQ